MPDTIPGGCSSCHPGGTCPRCERKWGVPATTEPTITGTFMSEWDRRVRALLAKSNNGRPVPAEAAITVENAGGIAAEYDTGVDTFTAIELRATWTEDEAYRSVGASYEGTDALARLIADLDSIPEA